MFMRFILRDTVPWAYCEILHCDFCDGVFLQMSIAEESKNANFMTTLQLGWCIKCWGYGRKVGGGLNIRLCSFQDSDQ